MKTIKLLTLAVLFITFASCDDDKNDIQLLDVASENISNLAAPQTGGQGQPISGVFAKFDFSTGLSTTSETEWDIAFRGTTIIINGGVSSGATDEPARNGNAAAYITNGIMAGVTSVDTSLLVEDSLNAHVLENWYTYAGPPTHAINPTPGKTLVIRTRDGKYAKVEILSYYENGAPNADFTNYRFYTFNYVYQPNQGVNTFN